MPFYDYQCGRCQAVFEIRASFAEKENGLEPECPECHGKQTHQVITAGQILRGGDRPALSQTCGPNSGPGCCG